MKLLLDTHVFLWALRSPERLAGDVLEKIRDANIPFYLSVVSGIEIGMKYAIGKLKLPVPPSQYVTSRCKRHGIGLVPLTMEQATAVGTLPLYHRDPFDRLLIAQAILESYTIVTADPAFDQYSVSVLKAA